MAVLGGAAAAGPGAAGGEPYLPPGERQELLREAAQCDAETEEARRGGGDKGSQQLLICLERGLNLRKRLYGEGSSQAAAAGRQLCEACNLVATKMLQTESFKGAHDLLKRAEQVAESDLDRAITWNNLAVYYRRIGKLRTAVKFLEGALAVEEHLGNADAAQTHLNLCATLSQLTRHTEALAHAQSALIRLYEILSPMMLSGELADRPGGADDAGQEQVSVLCIAYHNLAVEHEYLKNFDAALCAYSSGIRWAGRFLDESHQLNGILRESAEAVKAKLPRGSTALRRAQELAAGFPQKSSALNEGGSGYLANLMTPRGGRTEADEGEAAEPDEVEGEE